MVERTSLLKRQGVKALAGSNPAGSAMKSMGSKTFNKIIITGDSCRGKTTLALKISEKLNIPYYSTDDCLYEIKFTKKRDKQEGINIIEKVYKNEKWIVEGTTGYLIKAGLDSADIIISLTHKYVFTQWMYLIKRYINRDIENESIKSLLALLRHVLYKRYGWGYRKGKIKNSEHIEPHINKVMTLSSFKQIDDFINSL